MSVSTLDNDTEKQETEQQHQQKRLVKKVTAITESEEERIPDHCSVQHICRPVHQQWEAQQNIQQWKHLK